MSRPFKNRQQRQRRKTAKSIFDRNEHYNVGVHDLARDSIQYQQFSIRHDQLRSGDAMIKAKSQYDRADLRVKDARGRQQEAKDILARTNSSTERKNARAKLRRAEKSEQKWLERKDDAAMGNYLARHEWKQAGHELNALNTLVKAFPKRTTFDKYRDMDPTRTKPSFKRRTEKDINTHPDQLRNGPLLL